MARATASLRVQMPATRTAKHRPSRSLAWRARTVAGSNLVIAIHDDAPVAVADSDAVAAADNATDGNVRDGTGTTSGVADTQGADGATVVGIVAGTSTGPVSGNIGSVVHGTLGDLSIDAQGNYTYTRTGTGSGTDVFTYTLRDGDGDVSTTTLTINVAGPAPGNIVIPPPGVAGAGTLVDEAGLPARVIGGVSEPAGSNAASSSETTSGTISFTSPAGVQSVELGGHVITATSAASAQTFADATGSLSAWFSFDAATGGQIHYSYTLLDNTAGDATSASFAVAVTDTLVIARRRAATWSSPSTTMHRWRLPTAMRWRRPTVRPMAM